MTKLFAQPYDVTACCIYLESFEEYQDKAAKAVKCSCVTAEEFETQFIDGEGLDCALAIAWHLSRGNCPGRRATSFKQNFPLDAPLPFLAHHVWTPLRSSMFFECGSRFSAPMCPAFLCDLRRWP